MAIVTKKESEEQVKKIILKPDSRAKFNELVEKFRRNGCSAYSYLLHFEDHVGMGEDAKKERERVSNIVSGFLTDMDNLRQEIRNLVRKG